MGRRQFILEIEGFNGSLPFTTDILSYSISGLNPNQRPRENKETGQVNLTGFVVTRASDRYTIQFLSFAGSGKQFPKISLMESASVWGSTIKRAFLTCTGVGIENVLPREGKDGKTEDIWFFFEDYQLNA